MQPRDAARVHLSPLQAHALGVLVDCGTADAEEIARHMLVDGRRLGPVLGGLEKRALIQRTYTGHTYRRHAYYATTEGEAAYRAEFGGCLKHGQPDCDDCFVEACCDG